MDGKAVFGAQVGAQGAIYCAAMTIRKTTPAKPKRTTVSKRSRATAAKRVPKRELALWEKIVARGKRIPDEELARIPTDGARNLDHYLYGAPKQDPD